MEVDVELRINKGKGPAAFADVTFGKQVTTYGLPAFVKDGKIQVADKKRFQNGKMTNFNDVGIRDKNLREAVNAAATAKYVAMKEAA